MMKKRLLLLPALLVFLLPAPAQARSGRLDQSFGGDGRVITRVGGIISGSSSYFAWAGEGRIVAAAGTQLIEYLPDGRLDKRFGTDGRVEIAAAESRSFAPSGLAVDSRGRILLSGSSVKSGSGKSESSAVAVQRFLPNGRPDQSFGSGGEVLEDFGFPHPALEGGVEEQGPFVNSSGLAVDSADRLILTGSWVSYDPWPCYALYCYSVRKPFVARLQEDGSPDQSFGSGGMVAGVPLEGAHFPLATGGKVLFVASNPACGPRCGDGESRLGRLASSGSLDPSFGMGGFSDLPFYGAPSVSVDHLGRILMAGAGEEEGSIFLLRRLTSRGRPDNGFGDHGTRWMNLPRGCRLVPRALAVDHRNRPVLASDGRRAGKSYIIVFRRNQRGSRDREFGDNGQTWTRMPGSVSPTQVLIGGNGKILVAGTLSEEGLGLTRYDGGGR